MSDKDGRSISRRGLMSGLGGAAGGMASLVSGDLSGEGGDLFGGSAALSEAYKVADTKLWVGPDSAKSTVTAESGRVYYATDNQVQYIGDSGSWVLQGIGSSSQAVPSVNTREVNSTIVADPEDNCPGIRQAMSELPASGGTVLLKRGRYDVEDATFSNIAVPFEKDNINLIGQGWDTEIYLPDNTTETDKGKRVVEIGDHFNDVFVDNCTIAHLAVNGNYQNQGNISGANDGHNIEVVGSHNTVFNVHSYNATGDGVEMTSKVSPSETVKNYVGFNRLDDCFEQNIHLHGCHDSVVIGNICDGEVNNGMLECWTDVADTAGNIIIGNIFKNGQQEGAKLHTPETGVVARDNWFIGNKIINCSLSGVVVKSGTQNTVVAYNDVRRCGSSGGAGMEINGGSRVRASYNWIRDNNKHGTRITSGDGALRDLYFDNNWVYNNNQDDGNNRGIWVVVNSNNLEHIFVEDNEIVSEGTPLHYRPIETFVQNAATVNEFYVRDNYIRGKQGGDYIADNGNLSMIGGNTPTQAVDVRSYGANKGDRSWHDGTNSNTVGPAFYDGSSWTSLVDGTTIS